MSYFIIRWGNILFLSARGVDGSARVRIFDCARLRELQTMADARVLNLSFQKSLSRAAHTRSRNALGLWNLSRGFPGCKSDSFHGSYSTRSVVNSRSVVNQNHRG